MNDDIDRVPLANGSIHFSHGSEAHWSVYKALAEREYAVELTYAEDVDIPDWFPVRGAIIAADDDSITVSFNDTRTETAGATLRLTYAELKCVVIL